MGFFSFLSGKSGVNAANQAAEAQQAANARARGDITAGYTAAQGRISPYAEGGQRGYNAYNDAIGVNGSEGYGRAKANFDADPFRAGETEYTNLLGTTGRAWEIAAHLALLLPVSARSDTASRWRIIAHVWLPLVDRGSMPRRPWQGSTPGRPERCPATARTKAI
jgi:hypothetical protein